MKIESVRAMVVPTKPSSGCENGQPRPLPRAGQKLAVCQLLHGLPVGGAEMLAYRLAQRLSGEYRFMFLCLDTLGELGEALRAQGFPVWVLDRRPGLDWRCVLRISRILREERIDVVHAHQYTPFFYAAVARSLGSGTPICFTEHGRHQPDFPRRKRIVFNRLALRQRDRVIGVGETVRQALIVNEGISPTRVGVIYNGIDLASFASEGTDREAVRREIGVDPGDFVVVQVARLDYLKDHPTAIRAIAKAAARNSHIRLILVGEGPERARIEAEVNRLRVGGYVRMLGLRRDVRRILAAADAFLLTSVSEGIPLTLIEAMAAGRPVVSTRVGGVPEVIVEAETGLLAPSGGETLLAEALLQLAADPGLQARMGEAGRQRAYNLFSEEQMHAGYQKLYDAMVGRRGDK